MIAILGGFGAALCWGSATVFAARATRLIGAWSTVGYVMLIGLVATIPAIALSGPIAIVDADVQFLILAGLCNVVGLVAGYSAMGRGKVSVVAPIISIEGAIAAMISIASGEPVLGGTIAALAVVAFGVALAARESDQPVNDVPHVAVPLRAILLAMGAACLFGLGLYSTGRIGATLPVAWAILPARLGGAVTVALPLLLRGRLVMTRRALPYLLYCGLAEVGGTGFFAYGSSQSIAITAVLASQFAAVSAIIAVVFFHERLARIQVLGVVGIALGVAAVSWLQA